MQRKKNPKKAKNKHQKGETKKMRRLIPSFLPLLQRGQPLLSSVSHCSTSAAPTTAAAAPSTTSTSPNTTTAAASNVIVGNRERGVHQCSQFIVGMTDFVGQAVSTSHTPARLSAGEMLGLMDITAARTAMYFTTKRHTPNKKSEFSVATIGAEGAVFFAPVLHGDVLDMTAAVVHAGSSSIGVYLQAHRLPVANTQRVFVAEAFFSMVSIDRSLKAAKVVPAVELDSEHALAQNKRYKNIRTAQTCNETYTKDLSLKKETLRAADLEDEVNASKPLHVRMQDTSTCANRIFLTAHLNINNTIFGGELMRWMEQHATFCGRRFTRNRNVYSIGMHSVAFRQPVLEGDWVSLSATVVLVRHSTMEVDVILTVEREGGVTITNQASFVLINVDEVGQKQMISTGIELRGESPEALLRYALARHRYEASKKLRVDEEYLKIGQKWSMVPPSRSSLLSRTSASLQ